MFRGPWTRWKDIDPDNRTRMWERFMQLYYCDPTRGGQIYRQWEDVLKRRIKDVMSDLRIDAIRRAGASNVVFEGDFSVLSPYSPTWIKEEYWVLMLEHWNTGDWKKSSKTAKVNRSSQDNASKHTTRSISIGERMWADGVAQ